jgi:hypothetical protein
MIVFEIHRKGVNPGWYLKETLTRRLLGDHGRGDKLECEKTADSRGRSRYFSVAKP